MLITDSSGPLREKVTGPVALRQKRGSAIPLVPACYSSNQDLSYKGGLKAERGGMIRRRPSPLWAGHRPPHSLVIVLTY
jgi:hypothetical protein